MKLLFPEYISKGGSIFSRLLISSNSMRSDKSENYLFEFILLDNFNKTSLPKGKL